MTRSVGQTLGIRIKGMISVSFLRQYYVSLELPSLTQTKWRNQNRGSCHGPNQLT